MRMAREWAQQKGGMPKHRREGHREAGRQPRAASPMHDVERLARQAIFNDGALTEDDIKPLLAAKYQLLNRGGTLSFEADTARFAEVGGMKNLRRWILQRKAAFDGSAPGPRCAQGRVAARRAGLRQIAGGARRGRCARRSAGAPGFRRVVLQVAWRVRKEPARVAVVGRGAGALRAVAGRDREGAVHGRRRQRHVAPRAGRIPHLARRAAGACVHRRHGQRHHRAAARAGAQGPLRRDLLRRPALARRAPGDPRHPLQEARRRRSARTT